MSSKSIPDFFHNQDIFITGATGFLGKVLIEKLLRSCPDLRTIFILVRHKRGVVASDRLKEFSECVLFSKLLEAKSNALDKIQILHGDVKELELGLSATDRNRLKDVSIIFHTAASVRFDDPFQSAIFMNTRGTWEMLKLAESLSNLKVFMYVSTVYTCYMNLVIEEEVCPQSTDWRKTIQIAETFDAQTLDILFPKYANHAPNTYVFTKGLAEQICLEYSSKFPIAIYRPSVVLGVEKEPLPGWIANFYGAIGVSVAGSLGLMHRFLINKKANLFCTMADQCINGLIVAAWKRGVESEPLPVYNCVQIGLTLEDMFEKPVREMYKEMPFTKAIFPQSGELTESRIIFYFGVYYGQILPALIIDAFLVLFRRKPQLLKIQRTIYTAQTSLTYFVSTIWEVHNERFLSLGTGLSSNERKTFYLDSDSVNNLVARREYSRNTLRCIRKYLLNDPDETIPAAKRKYRLILLIRTIYRTILGIGLAYWLWTQLLVNVPRYFSIHV